MAHVCDTKKVSDKISKSYAQVALCVEQQVVEHNAGGLKPEDINPEAPTKSGFSPPEIVKRQNVLHVSQLARSLCVAEPY